MKALDIPDAIQWHEGLLLTPQHFQQLTQRHESLVQYSTSLSTPFCWGVRRFKCDGISLQTGHLIVLELEAVMPDGLLVWHDSSQATESLQLDLSAIEPGGSATVFLAALADESADSNGDHGRYEPFRRTASDVPGRNGQEIYRIRPRVSLEVGESLSKRFIGFPLARIIRKESFSLDPEFIPALLAVPMQSTSADAAVAAAARLAEMCTEVAVEIRKRAMYLADEERAAGQGTPARSEVTPRIMLSLVAGLPSFEAMLKIGVAHPLTVYLALCALTGPLTVLGKEMEAPNFAAYDHNDLYGSFKPVLDFIKRTLDQGVPLSYKSFPFIFEDSVFRLYFDGSWMDKRLALGVRRPHGMSEDDAVKWGSTCLIGSEGRIESIREKRIRGAARKHTERVGDVVPGKGISLFSLAADEDFIKADEVLEVRNAGNQPAELVLHVLDWDGSQSPATGNGVKP